MTTSKNDAPTGASWENDLRARVSALETQLEGRLLAEQLLARELASAKQREAELRDFFENGVEAIHGVGPDGTILFANQAEADLLGYNRDEYVGRNVREFHADPELVEEILARLSNGEALQNFAARLRCKDGTIKHVSIHSNAYVRDGSFIHTRCFTRDITEQKRALEELRSKKDEAEATLGQLKAVLAQMPSAVVIVETSGRILVSNEKTNKIFGSVHAPFSAAAAAGEVLGRHKDGREYQRDEWPLSRSIATGEIVVGEEIHFIRKDGTAGYVRVNSAPMRNSEDNIVGGIVTYDDVTAEKVSELELREQSRINENLARMATALNSELDAETVVEKVMDAAAALCRAQFGAFVHEVLNENGESSLRYSLTGRSREVFSKFSMPQKAALFNPTFPGDDVVRLDDVTKDPRYPQSAPSRDTAEAERSIRSYLAVPVKSRSGSVIGGLFFGHELPGIFTSIDERLALAVAAQVAFAMDNAKLLRAALRAEEAAEQERARIATIARELENANRAKDDFLATVSHELRTPLNAMVGWVRMLQSGALPAEKHARALETIERNAQVQTQLVEDLLDVSRIISGKMRLDVGSVDLPTVVEHAIEAVRPAALAKSITLRLTMDPRAAPILGDPDRLQQVVWNLLTNAVRFTGKGGTIRIAVIKHDSSAEIIVADNGQGIDPAFLPHLFERFRQADSTPSRNYGGLGLGLAIVRHLVELHGGSVSVESEGRGKGATFRVCLPLSPVQSSSLDRPPALRFTPSVDLPCPEELEGVRILVVDDEPDARDLLSEMLSSCKATVSVAASAREGLQLAQQLRPDVLVSDIGMPGEDGYTFIRKLRSLPPDRGGRTPAVALTAYARFEDRTKALVAGFNMHVPKPVEPTELLAVLSSLVTTFAPDSRGKE